MHPPPPCAACGRACGPRWGRRGRGLVVADAHHRGEGAGAHAVDGLQGEEAVGRGAAHGDLELLAEGLDHQRRAGHVAGGAHADVDDVLAHRHAGGTGCRSWPRRRRARTAASSRRRCLRAPRAAGSRRPPAWRARPRRGRSRRGCSATTGSKSFMSISGTKPAGFSPMTQADAAPQLSPGRRGQRGRALGVDVERQLVELGAVVDLDAVHGADALAQRAGVAAVAAVLRPSRGRRGRPPCSCRPARGARSRCP